MWQGKQLKREERTDRQEMRKIQQNWNKASKQMILHKVTCDQGPEACTKQPTLTLQCQQFTVNAILSRILAQSDKHMPLLRTQL